MRLWIFGSVKKAIKFLFVYLGYYLSKYSKRQLLNKNIKLKFKKR